MVSGLNVVPDDFPRQPSLGIVSGAQPKLLVRQVEGRYCAGPTVEELLTRYRVCEDLASQLSSYALRKMSESALSLDDVLARVEKGLKKKVSTGQWDFSGDEITWLMKRTRALLLADVNCESAKTASDCPGTDDESHHD